VTSKLLIPLDGSAFSRQILPHLRRLFSPEACALQLLHVAQPPVSADALAYPMSVGTDYAFYTYGSISGAAASRHPIYDSEDLQDFRRTLEDELREEASLFHEVGYNPTISVHFGNPVEEIVSVAHDSDADLVAMVTHGRQGLSRLLSGSVAEEVVRQLTIPVMLLNGTDDAPTTPEGEREGQ
jgi:nucleotide-binding universal stress UspA family protein